MKLLYRFVGGPKANQHVLSDGRPFINVVVQPRMPVSYKHFATLTVEAGCYRQETYFLYDFVSEGGAQFSQYVHESLIKSGCPGRETYADDCVFPEMPRGEQLRFDVRLAWVVGKLGVEP